MTRSMLACVVAMVMLAAGSITAQETKYGNALTLEKATPIAELMKNPEKYGKQRVRIEGEIAEVCQSMGCWIKISDSSSSEPILFKVEDGVMEFPKTGKGKKVKAEGVLSVKTTTKEELVKQAKHEAEEQGKPFDPAGISGPKIVLRIDGEGAVIHD